MEQTLEQLLSSDIDKLDLRPILPPSMQLAQIIASFANSGGGYIILGARKDIKLGYAILGLSMDFNASTITHKAMDFLHPLPQVHYGYQELFGKRVYVLKVHPSNTTVLLQGKRFIRDSGTTVDADEVQPIFRNGSAPEITDASAMLLRNSSSQTSAKAKLWEHYQSSLKLIDSVGHLLYPEGIAENPTSHEGKILIRILFSSIVDNFEIYLGELLYEIWLSNPNTLKSQNQVTVEQVLNCSDIEEFVMVYARERISKMKKGSIKTFIKDNNLISELGIFNNEKIAKIDRILQIRHLFAHSNGIVDDHFNRNYGVSLNIGDEFLVSLKDVLQHLNYLSEIVIETDNKAILVHTLSTL